MQLSGLNMQLFRSRVKKRTKVALQRLLIATGSSYRVFHTAVRPAAGPGSVPQGGEPVFFVGEIYRPRVPGGVGLN